MGQIIAFPVPSTAYPDLTADLDKAACVLLLAVRSWVESYRVGEDPIPRLCRGLGTAGAPDAAFSIDRLMALVARVVTRPIDIRCPRCRQVSVDEKHLLRAASLAQAGDSPLAGKVLRTTLLSAQEAEFTVGSLESLSELFDEAGLFLSLRRLPVGDPDMDDSGKSWAPLH